MSFYVSYTITYTTNGIKVQIKKIQKKIGLECV
jgi:hypothetical protein